MAVSGAGDLKDPDQNIVGAEIKLEPEFDNDHHKDILTYNFNPIRRQNVKIERSSL